MFPNVCVLTLRNDMKKYILFIFCLSFGFVNLFADQKGEVKTIGRYKQPGETVSGVIVRIHGKHNPVITDDNGAFTLVMKDLKEGDAYQFESVRKANYEILDQSLIGRDLAYSSTVPFTIVVVDKSKMEKERAAMQERFEKLFEDKYNKRVEEIETSFANKLISYEQRIDSLEQVENNYEQSKSRADDMINYYLRVNYDELDSLDQEINYLIEQGEFDKAKSLILSKGDINERTAHVEKLRELAERETNALVRDLLNLFEISVANYRNFEALGYAKQAYRLKPTDHACVKAYYASLANTFAFDNEFEHVVRENYQYTMKNYDDNSEEYFFAISSMILLHSSVYSNLDSCIIYMQKGLEYMCRKQSPDTTYLISVNEHISHNYCLNQDYNNALKHLKIAEALQSKLPEDLPAMIDIYMRYESIYDSAHMNVPKKCQKYYKKINEYFGRVKNPNSNLLRPMMEHYWTRDKNYDKALELAIKNLDVIYEENDKKITTEYGYAYKELACLYTDMKMYDKAIESQLKAIEIDSIISSHHFHFLSISYLTNLADIYRKAGDFDLALTTLDKTDSILHSDIKLGVDSFVFYYHRMALLCVAMGNVEKARYFVDEAEVLLPDMISHPKYESYSKAISNVKASISK